MDRILEIGSRISTPLGIAGFAVGGVLLIVWAAIKGGRLPSVTRQVSGVLLACVVRYLFVLALVALALGGVGFLIPVFRSATAQASDKQISGTILYPNGTFAARVRVVVAGTNVSNLTNDLGYVQLTLPASPANV